MREFIVRTDHPEQKVCHTDKLFAARGSHIVCMCHLNPIQLACLQLRTVYNPTTRLQKCRCLEWKRIKAWQESCGPRLSVRKNTEIADFESFNSGLCPPSLVKITVKTTKTPSFMDAVGRSPQAKHAVGLLS